MIAEPFEREVTWWVSVLELREGRGQGLDGGVARSAGGTAHLMAGGKEVTTGTDTGAFPAWGECRSHAHGRNYGPNFLLKADEVICWEGRHQPLSVELGGVTGLEQRLLRTSEGLSVKGSVSPDKTEDCESQVGQTAKIVYDLVLHVL